MSQQDSKTGAEELSHIEQRWPAIEKVRGEMATELEIRSEGLGGTFRAEIMAICDFLRGNARLESAIRRPGVLAVCNPLLKVPESREFSTQDIATATHQGLCTLARHGVSGHRFSRLLIFPAVLTIALILGLVFFSFYILQPFKELYTEFGIALPQFTMAVLGLAGFVRQNAILILLLTAGVPAVLYCLNLFGRHQRQPGESWLDQKLARRRTVVSQFVLHFSLLLEAGFSEESAIEKASQSSNRSWLNRRARRMRATRAGSKSFFGSRKFAMADTAILTDDGPARICLLRQVATWYRDSTSSTTAWWVELFVSFYFLFLMLMVFVVIFSLLSPFFSIISGLTGGGAPGVWF